MIDVAPISGEISIYDWGSKVEVRTDKDGKNPYLYGIPCLSTSTEDGKTRYFVYGREYDSSKISFFSMHRYLYSVKDLKKFRSAVRLRHMTLEDFINEVGFEKAGYDPETMEDWYICSTDGRLTDWE